MNQEPPTAEELKELVRRYFDRHHPGWRCASVSGRVGVLGAGLEETLLVLPSAPEGANPSVPSSPPQAVA